MACEYFSHTVGFLFIQLIVYFAVQKDWSHIQKIFAQISV
jgi:hypothetical protein